MIGTVKLNLILNAIRQADPKALPSTHWLALYGPSAGRIELFDSFGLSPINYNLDSLDPLNLSLSLQSPSLSVCGHYFVGFIYLCSRSHSVSDNVHLFSKISNRDSYVKRYIHNLQIPFRILNPFTVLVNVANYNVKFVKQIKSMKCNEMK